MLHSDRVYWTDCTGKKWDVDKMTDRHIRNAFKYLLRRIEEHRVKDDVLMDFILNGDVAQDFNDMNECNDIDLY